ncbi:uncharacterized protein LOC120407853 [Mauremys reevesii]|uniref:uncharacterized protein LOC120407853 n=1 Tax=Mauremys reevesii TaxID=260615 RepID=UPI00193FFADF|nr:uncharacterized protein LOC120407853 [Mauremys reevesii]
MFEMYQLTWENVATTNTDSASYMTMFAQEIKLNQKPEMLCIACPAHLINTALSAATATEETKDVKFCITGFRAIFKHANRLKALFNTVRVECRANCQLTTPCCATLVILYFAVCYVNNTWTVLMSLLDYPEFVGSKAETLKRLANNQNIYWILRTKISAELSTKAAGETYGKKTQLFLEILPTLEHKKTKQALKIFKTTQPEIGDDHGL